ncbi:MAG: Mut7-C RNAse domain-containing protein [Bryobacteraceae bacterium]
MKRAQIRFYAELNDFVPPERRFQASEYGFHVSPAVRDAIESLGVPHTEVDLILANGESVGFSHAIQDGDYISVYPVFESLDITPLEKLRPRPLRQPRFALDVHLGRLAAYLRLLGFDALYRNDSSDEELARLASQGERTLLTRDRGLLKRSEIVRGYWVRETSPRLQLEEVLQRFDLASAAAPFTRCLACNGQLASAAKPAVAARVPPAVLARHEEFLECPGCGRVFWKGTHWERMSGFIRGLVTQPVRS